MNTKKDMRAWPLGLTHLLALVAAALVLAPTVARAGGEEPPPPPPTPWYFTIHAGEVNYDTNLANTACQKVKNLNGDGVRFDIFWHDVEPSRDSWDYGKFQFYTNYVSTIDWYGLDPLVIFSGAPGWAIDLYNTDEAAFWAEYEEYVEQVVLWVGDRVDSYQLWNEANHTVDPIDAEDDWQLFTRAGAVLDSLDPTAVRYVNVMADLLGWESAVTDWVNMAGGSFDVIAIDHYPGTWACCSYTDWGPLDTLINRINNPGDAWYGHDGAIMETGYSSWAWLLADEYDQKDYINAALPVVRDKVNTNNVNNTYQIVAAGWYQLIDTCTDIYDPNNCWTDDPIYGQGIEAHFGIIHSNYSNKVGYNALKNQLSQF